MHRARLWLLVAAVVVSGANASAEEPADDPERIVDAAREFEEGRRAYRANEYDSAGAHFEAAHRVAPRADALRNAILARQKAKDAARAATLAAVGLVRYPDDAAVSQLVKPILSAAEKKLHRVELSCSTPCKIVTDKKLSPWPDTSEAVIYFEPGTHEIAVTWGRKSRQANVEATAGGKSAVKLSPPADAPIAAPSASAASSAKVPEEEEEKPKPPALPKVPPLVPIVGGGVTLLLTGVTIYSYLDMTENPGKEKVRADCGGRPASCATYQEALSAQRRTNVLFGVTAGVAVATGVVAVLFTDWSGSGTSTARARMIPYVTTDGRQPILGAAGTFLARGTKYLE